MTNETTFQMYWQEKESYFFRYALRKYASFRSRDSGEWEDAFSTFCEKLMHRWNEELNCISRDTWAFNYLNWTYLERIRANKNRRSLVESVEDLGVDGDDNGTGLGIDVLGPESSLAPSDARKLIAAVDSYLDHCVERFVKGKRNHMASRESVKAVFLLKITETDLNGDEIQVITGIKAPQQVAIKETIKQCIETRARLGGFGEVVDEVKKI